MKTAMVVSLDELVIRDLRWGLEDEGFAVLLSPTLEDLFVKPNQPAPSLIIVDADALPDHQWKARKLLHWFRHRSPVIVLSTESSKGLEDECDGWVPKTANQRDLERRIKAYISR
jgi:DNA-binding response OmpR family regulator